MADGSSAGTCLNHPQATAITHVSLPAHTQHAHAHLHGGLAAGALALLDAHNLAAQDKGLVGRGGLLEGGLRREEGPGQVASRASGRQVQDGRHSSSKQGGQDHPAS